MQQTITLIIAAVSLLALLVLGTVLLAGGWAGEVIDGPRFSPSGSEKFTDSGKVRPSTGVAESSLLADKDELRAFADQIVAAAADGRVADAFALMRPRMPLSEEEINAAEELTVRQLKMVAPRYGDAVGYEFIRSDVAGESLVKLLYIVKYEKHIVRWEFIFYRPHDKWMLNNFKWDDQAIRLFPAIGG